MVVYADILFLVNFSLNWFSLLLTSRLTKHRLRLINGICAAGIGAIAGILTLFFRGTLAITITEIASTFLMCAIAFNTSGFTTYARLCCCLFASGITLGGSLTLIYSFFNRAGIELKKQSDVSSVLFIMLSLAVTLAALIFERVMRSRKSINGTELLIEHNGKSRRVSLFSDSGNLLCEPISGKPAIIVGADRLAGLLPESILANDAASTLGSTHSTRFRLIPATGVCGSGLLLGFVPDSLKLEGEDRRELDAIIAIDKSEAGRKRRYAIIPSSII
ncbi:MAG: sigma-E processing peptidase SpoIIGA [Clostridia bacterium]|nr:sigma-E processing peptidase SpoIIGA [Clostridia bacterium]